MVVTVVLVVFITVSMAYNWSLMFGGSETPPREVEIGFQCLNPRCNHEFTMLNTEYQARTVDMEFMQKNPGRSTDMVDCPKCQQQHSAVQQLRCPSCEKFFLASKSNPRVLGTNESIPPPVCPHCGTDMNKWHRENHPQD